MINISLRFEPARCSLIRRRQHHLTTQTGQQLDPKELKSYQRLISQNMSRDTIFKISVSFWSQNCKVSSWSRITVFRIQVETLQQCRAKFIGCCKYEYVMIFGDNNLFVRFFSHSGVVTLFKFAISHSKIDLWQSLCISFKKPGQRIRCSKIYRTVLLTFMDCLAFHIFNNKILYLEMLLYHHAFNCSQYCSMIL